MSTIIETLKHYECKAWEALKKRQYEVFGRNATRWTEVNKNSKLNLPSPFENLVKQAREVRT